MAQLTQEMAHPMESGGNPGSGGGPPLWQPPGGDPPGCNRQPPPPSPASPPPRRTPGAGPRGGHPGAPAGPPGHQHSGQRPIDPWAPLDGSRKSLPLFKLPCTYRTCSILDMHQLLEDWLNKSTFAIAIWRGDAQRCWLEQVVETARVRHDHWLQSSPDQRANLETTYILGDRKIIPKRPMQWRVYCAPSCWMRCPKL